MNRFLTKLILFAALGGVIDASAKSLLFKNAIVHTVAKGDIENGQVLVTDGKISAVAKADENLRADETIDLKGAHLYPGFINAAGWLGLVEVDQIRATHDMSESGRVSPGVRAWVAGDSGLGFIAGGRADGNTPKGAVSRGGGVWR